MCYGISSIRRKQVKSLRYYYRIAVSDSYFGIHLCRPVWCLSATARAPGLPNLIFFFCIIGMAALSSPDIARQGDDRRSGIVISNVICYVLSVAAVLMRVASRSLAKVENRADDWWIWGALVGHDTIPAPVQFMKRSCGLIISSARLHCLHLNLPSLGPFRVGETRIPCHRHEGICIGKSRCPRANTLFVDCSQPNHTADINLWRNLLQHDDARNQVFNHLLLSSDFPSVLVQACFDCDRGYCGWHGNLPDPH